MRQGEGTWEGTGSESLGKRASRPGGVCAQRAHHGGGCLAGCDPEGCSTISGVLAPPPPPFIDPNLGVGGLGGQPLGSPGGSVGAQHTYRKMIPMTR